VVADSTVMLPALTPADRMLQRWRIRKALPWIRPGSLVLDVGCADGALVRLAGPRIESAVGIDPTATDDSDGRLESRTGTFPDAVRSDETFDAIVMLAVVEHVPADELSTWASACVRLLRPDGRLVITVPSPTVDRLLHWGMRLHLLAGMDAHHHHGFRPDDVPMIFGADLTLVHRGRFQLGLNNLFVFRR
jgi:2-polyprenyl-3-methyl-5-hydroxy-6-metoxy-1,4-benzoquinol methylase